MEALEQRLAAIEETIGNVLPNQSPLHAEVAELREELKTLKMDMVLKVPTEKLRELHKDPPIEDILSFDEKLFLIQCDRPKIDKHIDELQEIEKLSKIVFDTDVFAKIPDDSVLDDVRKNVDELTAELKKVHAETIEFLTEQSQLVNQTKDSWLKVKAMTRPST